MTVAIIRSSDVLPAPFGPSSPKTPGPVSRLTPATAWCRPNWRVTSFISTFMTVPSGMRPSGGQQAGQGEVPGPHGRQMSGQPRPARGAASAANRWAAAAMSAGTRGGGGAPAASWRP